MTDTEVKSRVTSAPGSQTLARGLSALQLVAAAHGGLTIQQVADRIGLSGLELREAEALCRELKCQPGDLLDYDD